MPWGLYRFQQSKHLHFITFSCYRRLPYLESDRAKRLFEQALEQVRRQYRMYVIGYVVMPEHVHLLVTEPERETLAVVIQALKQSVARREAKLLRKDPPKQKKLGWGTQHFWQARYYDFNVRSPEKRIEKLKYIHRNPVKRGLVAHPEDWPWSSYRHYAIGEVGAVEIASPVTEWKRRQIGKPQILSLPEE
jgi:putative transposase